MLMEINSHLIILIMICQQEPSRYGGYFKLVTDNGSVDVSTNDYESNKTYTPSESISNVITYADFIVKPISKLVDYYEMDDMDMDTWEVTDIGQTVTA